MDYFRNLHLHWTPPPPGLVDQQYMVEFYNAHENQCNIGWENFWQGMVSKNWRFLQHCHFLNCKTHDIHAVDKWTRMFIKSILELSLEPSVFLVQTRKSLTSVLNWEKRMRVSLLHFAEKESHDIRRFMAEKIFLSEWY